MRAAKTELAAAERRWGKSQNNKPLRTSRAVRASAGKCAEAARCWLLMTTHPLAHGGDGGVEKTSGGLEAMLASLSDQAQAMVVGALHFPHQGEVGSGHGCGL